MTVVVGKRQQLVPRGRKIGWRSALCVAALACSTLIPLPTQAIAQSDPAFPEISDASADGQLLLQADELIYDNDAETITALGEVRIDYEGTRLVADRLIYRQQSGRLIAVGSVEILQPDGTRSFAEEIDITDDFRDGFVNALRVVTPERVRFAAESATRENGSLTTFVNGVYTACEVCPNHPERPPLWQIKAQKIIWNGEEKTIRFERARFEFLGVPIAGIPVFTTADPSVKRKTGFLAPNFRYAEELGFGLRVPFFVNLAPNRDVTLAVTGYTKQGFLAEAEYRHRLESGTFTLKTAGIHQFAEDQFAVTDVDSTVENRAMVGTTGEFDINSRWVFGWNGMLQTDANFSRTYDIEGYDSSTFENNIYLTGLGDRSHFDARAMKFDRQIASVTSTAEEQQPTVLPSVDYNYTLKNPVAGGELSFDVNARGINRDATDDRGSLGDVNFATPGVDSDSWRLSAQTEWKRTFIAPGGLVFTPILHAQADTNMLNGAMAGPLSSTMATDGTSLLDDGTYYRSMVTAGLEVRYPILFSTAGSSHVLEPIAQVFVRPDEQYVGQLANEDSQSLVFDASTLFQRDKFSGYDRMEGGTRANLGIRYTGTFDNGWGINGAFGQSYHLAGMNSFAGGDNFNTGASSGLETDRSDFVGSLSVSSPSNFAAGVGARFDESTFEVRRAEASASYSYSPFRISTNYAFIDAQPEFGFMDDRHEVTTAGSISFLDNWSVFGSTTYDLTQNELDKYSVGISYYCDCFLVRATYTEDKDNNDAITRNYSLFISLRTLGEFGTDTGDFDG